MSLRRMYQKNANSRRTDTVKKKILKNQSGFVCLVFKKSEKQGIKLELSIIIKLNWMRSKSMALDIQKETKAGSSILRNWTGDPASFFV